MHTAQQILDFWFGGDIQAQQAAAAGQLDDWLDTAPASLALVILLDQFPHPSK